MNKLIDEQNNSYHRSNDKKPIDADYPALTEETESSHKAPKFKGSNRVLVQVLIGLPSTRILLAKITPKISQTKYL